MKFAEGHASAPEVVPAALEVAPSHDPEYVQLPPHANGSYTPWSSDPSKELKDFEDSRSQRQRICGLSPRNFWIILIALFVIAAAAVGGGIGGGLASQNKSGSSSIASSTGTRTASATTAGASATSTSSSSHATFSSGCNTTDGSNFTPANAAVSGKPYTINGTAMTYAIHCYTNLPDSSSGLNPQITKVGQLLHLVSLEDCITACALYNNALYNAGDYGTDEGPQFDQLCSGVVYYTTDDLVSSCDLNRGVTDNATRVAFSREVDSAILDWNQ